MNLLKKMKKKRKITAIATTIIMAVNLLPVAAIAETTSISQNSQINTTADNENVLINEANFPDAVFRDYISSWDINNDRILSSTERKEIRYIEVYGKNIHSVKGIEFFPELSYLDCGHNQISNIDVSKNALLEWLDCRENQISNLDVHNNHNLQLFDCSCNLLTELNLSENTILSDLVCAYNQLGNLDLSNNRNLVNLNCTNTQLCCLNLNNNPDLMRIYCNDNFLSNLDVSADKNLRLLQCRHNKITNLDVSGNTELIELDCSSNQLSNLDTSTNDKLERFSCGENYYITNSPVVYYHKLPGNFDLDKADHFRGIELDQRKETFTFLEGYNLLSYSYDTGHGIETFNIIYRPKEQTVVNVTTNGHGWAASNQDTVKKGDIVTLQAKADEGYKFKEWKILKGDINITNNSFVMPEGTVEIRAIFEKIKNKEYAVRITNNGHGFAYTDKIQATPGDVICLHAEAEKGYKFKNWKVIHGNININNSNTPNSNFVMPDEDIEIIAIFEKLNEFVTNPFIDVYKTDYFYKPVLWAVENNITGGTSANTFSPNQSCTRAQAVTFLWNKAGKPEPKMTNTTFLDVSTNSYYAKAVQWAVEQGITSGVSATSFAPNTVCSRSQIVTFQWRANGSPVVSLGSTFNDVNVDAYYAKAIQWAVKNNITNGTGGNNFSPDLDCTRGQIVTFLYNEAY